MDQEYWYGGVPKLAVGLPPKKDLLVSLEHTNKSGPASATHWALLEKVLSKLSISTNKAFEATFMIRLFIKAF